MILLMSTNLAKVIYFKVHDIVALFKIDCTIMPVTSLFTEKSSLLFLMVRAPLVWFWCAKISKIFHATVGKLFSVYNAMRSLASRPDQSQTNCHATRPERPPRAPAHRNAARFAVSSSANPASFNQLSTAFK